MDSQKILNTDLYKIHEKFPIKTAMQGRTKYVFFNIVLTEKSNFRLLSKAKVFAIEKSQSFTGLEFIFCKLDSFQQDGLRTSKWKKGLLKFRKVLQKSLSI